MSHFAPKGRPPQRAITRDLPARAIVGAQATRVANGSSAQRPERGRPRRVHDPRSCGASVGWTLAGAVIPGVGLIKTRWRPLGIVMVLGLVVAACMIALTAVLAPNALLGFAVRPAVLRVVWIALLVAGALWISTILLTHLGTRPRFPTGPQRVAGAALVGVLSLAIALPTFVGARSIYDTSSLIEGVFQGTDDPADGTTDDWGTLTDSWAKKPRLNVLILGGDSGQSRRAEVGARTDSVLVATIDTRTGQTSLISLPRQTQRMPFPAGSALKKAWPNGFTNGVPNDPEYFLNAMYNNVPTMTPDAVPATAKDKGAAVLKASVGEALGLPIDYYAMINMDGFIELIDALGGITVNINRPIPVGGSNFGAPNAVPPDRWLEPGPSQHLNGWDALWYARGRYSYEDYDRMARQRCMIQAVTAQANPATVLTNYESLARAGKNIVATDVPNALLPALLELALRVKGKPMTSMGFENGVDGFSTVTPTWTTVRERVKAFIAPVAATTPTASAAPTATPTPTPVKPTKSPTPSKTRTPSASPTPSPTPTPSVPADPCAYDPTAWKPGQKPGS